MRTFLQAGVYGSPEAVLTPALFRAVLNMKLHEHKQRDAFLHGQQTLVEAEKQPSLSQ